MENATEALKLAAWVLIFVIALSMCINSFSEARQTMDAILEYNDKEYNYTYVEGQNGSTQRIVGYESIIPTMYRAYKENYKIIFPEGYVLYKKTIDGKETEINYIDLEKESIGSQEQANLFIKIIVNGGTVEEKAQFHGITFNEALYEYINSKEYVEHLGEYFQEEAGITEELNVADVNKTKKRVITYEEKQ